MTATEAIAARSMARVFSSAIRALGNPNDPSYAFASSLVNELMPDKEVQPAPTTGQVRDLYGADGTGTVTTDPQRPGNGTGGAVAGGPPAAPAPELASPPSSSQPPDGPQEPQGPPDPNVQRIEIIGNRWPRDDDGIRLEVDAQGNGVMHLATGGIQAIGAVSEVLPGLSISGGRIAGSLLTLLRGPGALALLLTGDTPRVTLNLNEYTRYERFEDQAYGRLLERDPVTGDWQVLRDDVREYQQPTGFAILSDEQLRNQQQPITTPALPPGDSSPPPLPVQGNEREGNVLPGAPATPPAMPTIESYPAEQMRLDDLIIESRGLAPGTGEHKTAAWEAYNQRPNHGWDYERWSATYDSNQLRASAANQAVRDYQSRLGWGATEQTVDVEIDGQVWVRRLDIADRAAERGIEYKTGYQSATVDNLWEVERDAKLVARGWDIEWVFRDSASRQLLEALDRAGIKHRMGE
jgi:hypothetical protein